MKGCILNGKTRIWKTTFSRIYYFDPLFKCFGVFVCLYPTKINLSDSETFAKLHNGPLKINLRYFTLYTAKIQSNLKILINLPICK